MDNLYSLPTRSENEVMESLAESECVRIERIVSFGQATPPGHWYDQDEHEWVVVLKGKAKLLFEGDKEPVDMYPGDYLDIPAHRRHRVEWTAPDEPTVWLAVFYRSEEDQKKSRPQAAVSGG